MTQTASADVSIIIPVFNKIDFTRQCLDRIWRNTSETVGHEVIVVDNGSSDGTREFFETTAFPRVCRYHRNDANLGFARGSNIGAGLSGAKYLLFLNNDTLVQPKWLEDMVALAESDPAVGIVGIKQLLPYTNTVYHTGIVFTDGGQPRHLYSHADARLPQVNQQREYQAVNGACLLIRRELFEACGRFDEGYSNGHEDIDLCLTVRQRGLKVVCCTSSFIYHYCAVSEGRLAANDQNVIRFASKWGERVRIDAADYDVADMADTQRQAGRPPHAARTRGGADALYFIDPLGQGNALSWGVADLVLALRRLGAPAHVKAGALTRTIGGPARRELEAAMTRTAHPDGVHIKWSHYWPQHLDLDLAGRINLELFVINYRFGQPGQNPWDYWLQCLAQNHAHKLPLTQFCRDVLLQVGVKGTECDVLPFGYSTEVHEVEPTSQSNDGRFRFLTVTNSRDLPRYGTVLLLEAYWEAFRATDDVTLVVKDYGGTSGDPTLRNLVRQAAGRARVELVDRFTSKKELIRLYRSCDAFVSAHRAEGFGMKILDALACGLPVVTPLFGGPADFCRSGACFPVAYAPAPMGDCLDTRSLRITNQPLWCEPSRADLVRQLRAVATDPGAARAVGEAGRQAVIDRFTWDAAARRLLAVVDTLRDRRARTTPTPARLIEDATVPAETSPHWLGRRISVIVPTHNRRELLLECLDALARQSVLPSEFEVIVIDDGSTDGTEAAVRGRRFSYPLEYHRQTNQGPAAARNLGITKARGEIVLLIGDDIIPDERLLEHHLLAHVEHPDRGAAVLGHIAWAPWLAVTPVMDYVGGEGALQFSYRYIPNLSALDYRFFYTSNVSLKRRFLLDAFEAGLRFDSCFRYAALEDSEFAYRLEGRGLTLHYCKDALAFHDHWMDLETFARREYNVGRMAVVYHRKHPRLDDLLHVRWIGDWVESVETLLAQPALLERVKAVDAQTDQFLVALERSLEELSALETSLGAAGGGQSPSQQKLRTALHTVLAVIFDAQRTRGKVEEWYAGVDDRAKVEAAKSLLGCLRKLDFLSANRRDLRRMGTSIAWLDPQAGVLRAYARELTRQVGGPASTRRLGGGASTRGSRLTSAERMAGFRGRAWRAMRAADLRLQRALREQARPGWFRAYLRVRSKLKELL
jgi:GT2 family glycosyltransferase/glycosyltransferase involved in cell wall biosynthesis